jgi:hypothetical protein
LTVGAAFGEEQRTIPGDVLEPRHIRTHGGFVVEVDVEGVEVEKRQLQKIRSAGS